MLEHELSNHRQFMATKATVRRQCDRIEPKLHVAPGMSNVNVGRLAILQAVEEKSVTANPQQCWQGLVYTLVSRSLGRCPG